MSAVVTTTGRCLVASEICRVRRSPARTQSGHWNPTAAETMQSVQIGRSQRWQRTAAARRSCR